MKKKSIVETILTADDKTLDTILQEVKIDVFYRSICEGSQKK